MKPIDIFCCKLCSFYSCKLMCDKFTAFLCNIKTRTNFSFPIPICTCSEKFNGLNFELVEFLVVFSTISATSKLLIVCSVIFKLFILLPFFHKLDIDFYTKMKYHYKDDTFLVLSLRNSYTRQSIQLFLFSVVKSFSMRFNKYCFTVSPLDAALIFTFL